jgi:hypothetical protein
MDAMKYERNCVEETLALLSIRYDNCAYPGLPQSHSHVQTTNLLESSLWALLFPPHTAQTNMQSLFPVNTENKV